MSKTESATTATVSAIIMLGAAAGLWYVLKKYVVPSGDNPTSAALELGKQYLGFATSLAGFLGIAIGGASLLNSADAPQTRIAMTRTATALLVTLAGGAMVGKPDPQVLAAAIVAGGLLGAGYIFKS